jgi:glycolate oxidase
VKTVLLGFPTLDSAANTVSRIIATGYVPAAMELMDQRITEAVEEFVHAGLPVDAAAILLVEVDGTEAAVEEAARVVAEIAHDESAISSQIAQDEATRAIWWKARKSAFGALARIAPNYYLHDGVVPRTRLTETLRSVCDIADSFDVTVVNVAHAGDGNLHPIIPYDGRDQDQNERVHEAGNKIAQLCVANGGALSGEHGIGLEKRDLMGVLFGDDDLVEQDRLRLVFDPERIMNPHKVLPEGSRCSEVAQLLARAGKAWA